MQIDQRFVQNLQNQNNFLRQQVAKLSGNVNTLDEKYQKSLKQMSSIIHANQNLKQELDNIKSSAKDQIQGAIREVRSNYQKRIEEILKEKNDLNLLYQNSMREKEQMQRDYSNIQRKLWENQALKNQVAALKKQNQKLLLQTHPLTQNQDNPQQKVIEQKFSQKIDELNNKIAQLNVQNTQARKNIDSIQSQKQNLQRQIQSINKKNNELSQALEKAQSQIKKEQQISSANKALQAKSQQVQVMDLRKRNAELLNEIQRLKLQKLEMVSQVNKTQAQMHLLGTLKSLHSQLQPMRYQIQQLKRDKYFDRQSTIKQKADLQMKMLSTQHQLQSLKQYIKDLQTKNRQISQQLRQKQWQKNKFQQMQQQKRILQGRVIVYQAMQMVTRNRDKPHHVQRIQQFQRRIHLLLQQQNLQYLVNNANVHQLIAMKAYVIELDNKLQLVIEQNEHFHKKYSQYKQKYQLLIAQNKQIINKHYSMVNAYKGKISGYQKLVLKLTQQLQRYLKDSQGPSNIQSHYKSVITLYESKIMSVHNQINSKKQQNRELLKKYQNMEMQYKGKLAYLRQLQQQLSSLKSQNKDLQSSLLTKSMNQSQPPRASSLGQTIPQDHYKRIITQKTKQILQLQQQLSKLKYKLDKIQYQHERDLQNSKHKISRLQIEIQHLRLEQSQANKQISTNRNNQQLGELFAKINSLERAVSKSQVTPTQPQQHINAGEYQHQILLLKQQNEYLIKQLQSTRNQLKRKLTGSNININTQINRYQDQINRLKDQTNRYAMQYNNRILQLEAQLKIKIKQLQIKSRQIERLTLISTSQIQSHVTITQPYNNNNNNNNLQQENRQLKTQLDRIKINYKSMTLQCEGLMKKIRDTQQYIGSLKDQFDSVGYKMNQYQKQISNKDQIIHEWKLKYNNLQLQYSTQLSNTTYTANNRVQKDHQQKQRKLRQLQHQLQTFKRQIQSKIRQLERRELQSNRRQSQIDSKSRQILQRLRKLEQRQRIVVDQETRLIHWSDQLQRKQKNIQQRQRQQYQQTPAKDIKNYITSPINQGRISQSYRQQIIQLQRRIKRLQLQLTQKQKILQIKDQKLNRFIKEKSQLNRELQDIKLHYIQKQRIYQQNQRNIHSLRSQVSRLESQQQKLWKQYDNLKQQLRNKQREYSDAQLQIQQLRRKLQLQKRQYTLRISDLQSRQSQQYSPAPAKKPDYTQIQRQYQQRIQSIQQRNRNKIRQLYKQNQQHQRQLQQTISQLSSQLSKLKLHANINISPTSNRDRQDNYAEISGYKATIRSLQARISSLQDELRWKQNQINQSQNDISYYKNTLTLREQELHKLYETTHVPMGSTSEADHTQRSRLQMQVNQLQSQLQLIQAQQTQQGQQGQINNTHEFDAQRSRLQTQITQLQHQLQIQYQQLQNINNTRQSDYTTDHSQCIKKQHVLRMEIQRLNGMLQQSRQGLGMGINLDKSQHSQKAQTPQSHYIDNSYLNQLQDTNRKLQQDLTICRQRLIADFDQKRSIQEYLLILAITFAEVDALRQRVYELEQNFKQQHERQMTILKQIDGLKDQNVDIQQILAILRQLQASHRAFHQEESRSKTMYIENINTKVLTLPATVPGGSSGFSGGMFNNTFSIHQEFNKYGSIGSSGIGIAGVGTGMSSSGMAIGTSGSGTGLPFIQNPIPFNYPSTTPFTGSSFSNIGSIDTRRLDTVMTQSGQGKSDSGERSIGYNLHEDNQSQSQSQSQSQTQSQTQSGLGFSNYVPGVGQSFDINKYNFTSSLGSSEFSGGIGGVSGSLGGGVSLGGYNRPLSSGSGIPPSASFPGGMSINTSSPMKQISPISNIGSLSGSGLGATYGGGMQIGGGFESTFGRGSGSGSGSGVGLAGMGNQPNQPYSSLGMPPLPPRPSSFSTSFNTPSILAPGPTLSIPGPISSPSRRVQFSPGKQPRFDSFSPSKPINLPIPPSQQYPFYHPPPQPQHSNQVSQSSLRYPSQSRLPQPNISYGTSQSNLAQPFMIGSNQMIR